MRLVTVGVLAAGCGQAGPVADEVSVDGGLAAAPLFAGTWALHQRCFDLPPPHCALPGWTGATRVHLTVAGATVQLEFLNDAGDTLFLNTAALSLAVTCATVPAGIDDGREREGYDICRPIIPDGNIYTSGTRWFLPADPTTDWRGGFENWEMWLTPL